METSVNLWDIASFEDQSLQFVSENRKHVYQDLNIQTRKLFHKIYFFCDGHIFFHRHTTFIDLIYIFFISSYERWLEGTLTRFGEIVWCNRVLMRTSNTIALHGVTRKERAKTRLMQIFVRSSGERNLSASHNLEDTVVTILIGVFVIEILWCAMKKKKYFASRFSFIFDERLSKHGGWLRAWLRHDCEVCVNYKKVENWMYAKR